MSGATESSPPVLKRKRSDCPQYDVTLGDEHNVNVILFIFDTIKSRRYLLHVNVSNRTFTGHEIDWKGLQDALSGIIDLPEGELIEICTIENVLILMWNFTEYIGCRSAGRDQFIYVETEERLYKFAEPCQTASISLPFFILKDKLDSIFYDEDRRIIKESYVYPIVNEDQRKMAFQISLQSHNYKVHPISTSKSRYHFCQFSGGGDFYITKHLSTLAVVSSDLPQTAEKLLNVSPISSSESQLISLSVETKKQTTEVMDLKYQLWANMFLLAVEQFKEHLMMNTKESLIKLEKLVGYGMACSGNGVTGAFKVEIPLIEGNTKFITKLKLGARDRMKAASLMDYILKYFDHIERE